MSVTLLDGPVVTVTLKLYTQDSSTMGYEARSVVDNTWQEMSLTGNTAPPVGVMVGAPGAISANNRVSVDIMFLWKQILRL